MDQRPCFALGLSSNALPLLQRLQTAGLAQTIALTTMAAETAAATDVTLLRGSASDLLREHWEGTVLEHSPLPVLSQEIRCRASQQRDVGGSSCLRCHGGECNGLRQASGLQALKQWKRIAGQPEGKTRALIHSGRDRQQGQGCGGLNVGAG